ncbi:dTDP-4-dehydrorhamnose 3,5-epimerase [Pigmentibacter ruber]
MKIISTDIPRLIIIEPNIYTDSRGFFFESYQIKKYSEFGIPDNFVQDNFSQSSSGVLRGLHYQLKNPQAKLVSVIKGEVFDVAVDIRLNSPTFGKWFGTILSGENRRQIYIPKGFAHGFYVLSNTAEFTYKCSDFYYPDDEYGIIWNDPSLNIDWPLNYNNEVILSQKDKNYNILSAISNEYLPIYEG